MPPAALDRLIAATTPSPSPSPSPSASPSPSPSPIPTSPSEIFDRARSAVEAAPACGRDDISVCGITLRITGSDRTAQIVSVIFGRPLEIAVRIAILLVLAVLVRRALHKVIDQFVDRVVRRPAEEAEHSHHGPPRLAVVASDRREQRARTLASVLKSITTGVIGVVVVITVFGELGFPIGGLLASAGVVGVALGFGCQALVRDFVSGIFMIVEDQYGVGDTVDVGEATGTVEAVGLRVTRLRDVNGTVWYVRNGEILRVGNQSQGWARAVLDISVAYGEDIDRAQDLLQGAAAELRHDAAFSSKIIEEPEVWGIERMTPEAVVIRVVVKTQPAQQFAVARELRRRFIQVLASNDITLPAQPWAGGLVDGVGTVHANVHPAAPPPAEPPPAATPATPGAAAEGDGNRSGNQQDQDVEQRPRGTGSVSERPPGS